MFESENYDEIYENLEFNGEDLTEITFEDCIFRDSSFQQADFSNSRFINCTFERCNISLIRVKNTQFNGLRILDSKASGINWTEAPLNSRGIFSPPEFSSSILQGSVFQGLNLEDIVIKNCKVTDVDFSSAILKGADLKETDFERAHFNNTDLSTADLRGAVNYSIDMEYNRIKKARFSLPEAVSLLKHIDIILD